MREKLNVAEIHDVQAASQLRLRLDLAFEELLSLGADPAIVAACPHKFNDVMWDDGWRAVRAGSFRSERADYFDPPRTHEKRISEGPPEAQRASAVLDRLEVADWRGLYERAIGRELYPEEVLALVVQDGRAWFVLSASNYGGEAVYELPRGGSFRHIGRSNSDADHHRFDQRLGKPRPLIIRTIEQDAADRAAAIRLIEAFERRAPANRTALPKSEPSAIEALSEEGRIVEARAYRVGISVAQMQQNPLYQRLDALRVTKRISDDEYRQVSDLLWAADEHR